MNMFKTLMRLFGRRLNMKDIKINWDNASEEENDTYTYTLIHKGVRKVSEMSEIEMEMLLTDIVQRALDGDFIFEIIECLAEAELVELEEVKS